MLRLIFLFMFLSAQSLASTTWYCAHPELCNLMESIIEENKIQGLDVKKVVQPSGDPHEYEPTSEEIKNLIRVNHLIIGPKELNPWITKIISQKSKDQLSNQIEFNFSDEDLKQYSYGNKEALSHFWLYPKIYCSFKKNLIAILIKNGLTIIHHKTCEKNEIENKLREVLTKNNIPIIVTHDALTPLLKTLSANQANIISLKGSGHHEEIISQSIKKLYRALESKKVIWIKEKNITIPSNISSKIRTNDYIIEIDTSLTKKDSPFNALVELESKIKTIVNK